MNVLVYSGKGTTKESVKHTIESLRSHLSPYYAVVMVSESALLNDPWQNKTAMLVMPGGADLPYCDVLNGRGNSLISLFVRKGGRFLGFCAGGYYGAKRCEFEVGDPHMEVSGPRELAFFPGTAKGCVYKGFDYATHAGARAVHMRVSAALADVPHHVLTYYNGGGMFMDASRYANVEILASYVGATDVADSGDMAAVVHCKVGLGDAILTGTHPEFTTALMRPQELDVHFRGVVAELEPCEAGRRQFLRACLARLGLRVNSDSAQSVPQLTPIYLTSCLDPARVQTIVSDLRHNMDFVSENTFEDIHDTFLLHEGAADLHLHSTRAESVDELCEGVKHIHAMTNGLLPDLNQTPYFDMHSYYDRLRRLYDTNNVAAEHRDFGSVLAYAEVVTSTNTLLDANPNWLRHLPSGLTFTATTQIAGRGRGGNVWINPKGVMATSIVFRIPTGAQQSSSIVTLQYLCSLAMIELILSYGSDIQGQGCGYEDMPLRLKWPNDMYALKPDFFHSLSDKDGISTTVDGDDEKWAKVSGALINSQFLNGQFYLVWGGGINVSNSAPTTSLNLVLEKLNQIRGQKGLAPLPPYEHETLLAKLVFTMGQFYSVFQRLGLKPFLPLYYKRWFHLAQQVRVEAEAGRTRQCVVRGITAEYGLLVAEDVATRETLELQPDGNSFDIFKGLVYKKRG